MGVYKDLFLLAAKAGSLEGYSYDRTQFSMQHMPGWIGNIERMYSELPTDVKAECAEEYCAVLETAKKGLRAALGDEHPLVAKIQGMIGTARSGA